MSNDRWARVGAAGGIVFVLLLVAGLIFGPGLDPPSMDDNANHVTRYVTDNHAGIQAVGALDFAAGFAFLFFLGSIVLASRAAEGAPGRLSAVAAAGGIAFVAIAGVGVAAHSTAALQLDNRGGDPHTIAALWDLGQMAFVFMGFASAALLWAVGLLAMRFGAIPALIGIYSLAVAIYTFVISLFSTFTENGAFSPRDGLLGELGLFLFLAWVLAVSAALVASPVYTRARGRR
jgi:hypothetical protein